MQTRQLGPNGPIVGAIGFGGMPISINDQRPSEAESVKLLLRAADLGATLWDTADAYALNNTEIGHNERLFDKAFAELSPDLKERVVIATKGGHTRSADGGWDVDGRPEYIKSALDASLQALNVDCIDLYQHHRPDPKVPYADTMGALAEAKAAGKIKCAGISNASAEQIEIALSIVPIISVQYQYSPIHRAPETDGSLAKCIEHGLAFLPWSPLGGMGGAKDQGKDGALATIAAEYGISPQRVILAWLLSKYDRMFPIPGTTRIEAMEDNAKATELVITEEQITQLDAAFV
jgi:aryl-alcohol dehydrogenase-like predicted oxidoreductase